MQKNIGHGDKYGTESIGVTNSIKVPDYFNSMRELLPFPAINKEVIKMKLNIKSKCKTCMGYGLWAFGDPSPVGPMDASDGIPTKTCPECGANANPIKKEKKRNARK